MVIFKTVVTKMLVQYGIQMIMAKEHIPLIQTQSVSPLVTRLNAL